jgi:hypothetical protein
MALERAATRVPVCFPLCHYVNPLLHLALENLPYIRLVAGEGTELSRQQGKGRF